MKNNIKKIIAVLSAASLLFLGACSDKPVNGTDVQNQTVEVAVDKFTAEYIFGENGLIEKEKKFYDNQETTYEYYECYEYNENGQITKRYATDLEGNILEKHDLFEMTYNENGGIAKITEDESVYNFIYNDDGSLKQAGADHCGQHLRSGQPVQGFSGQQYSESVRSDRRSYGNQ